SSSSKLQAAPIISHGIGTAFANRLQPREGLESQSCSKLGGGSSKLVLLRVLQDLVDCLVEQLGVVPFLERRLPEKLRRFLGRVEEEDGGGCFEPARLEHLGGARLPRPEELRLLVAEILHEVRRHLLG